MIYLKYAAGWIALVIVAIANGIFREKWIARHAKPLTAHQLSTLLGLFLFGAVIYGMTRIWPFQAPRQAWLVGCLWLFMTVLFEFVFGHYVAGHSWSTLMRDYNMFAGRLWVLVLIWTFVSPWLFAFGLKAPD